MSDRGLQTELIEGIRKRGGRATLGDLMSTTARSADEIQNAIIPALNGVGGHVAVDENGELVYSVLDPRRLPDERSALERTVEVASKVLSVSFITALSVTLVAYFAFYIVLLVCLAVVAVIAAAQGGDCDCPCDGCECLDCAKCGDGCGDCCVIGGSEKKAQKREIRAKKREVFREKRAERKQKRLETAADRRERRHDALVRARQRVGLRGEREVLGLKLERETVTKKPKFYRAVYDFIFGPPRVARDARERERNIVAFIRAHLGRITAADVVTLTGLSIGPAERLLLDITARYEGDIEVSENAALIYRFDRLVVSVDDDVADLAFIAERGHAISVADFARQKGQSAVDALKRLQHLARNYHGAVDARGGSTRFVFPATDAGARRGDGERDYTYCWERLERSPAILGIPEGERGWLYGFNILNLVLSIVMSVYYAGGSSILGGGASEAWLVGYLPLLFSASVFGIPIARWLIRGVANGTRLRRNAWRVFLLALFHRLEESDRVRGAEILESLFGPQALIQHGRPGPDNRQQTHLVSFLERAIRELDGSIDAEAGLDRHGEHTYLFERLHDELNAVERERLTVDLRELQVQTIVYDSADPEM